MRLRRSDRLVLGYHTIAPHPGSPLAVSPAALRRQVSALVARGYTPATFADAVASRSGARLAVTFDDGERNALELALPVLSALGAVGTVFAPVATVGRPGLLGWPDLAALAAAGWEVGSHTVTHPHLRDVDDASLARELRDSRERLEDELGRPCRSIAYPFGETDARVCAAAAAAGYTAGCTSGGGLRGDPLAWPRVGVGRDDGPLAFRIKTSRTGRALRGSSAGAALTRPARAARTLLARQRLRQT